MSGRLLWSLPSQGSPFMMVLGHCKQLFCCDTLQHLPRLHIKGGIQTEGQHYNCLPIKELHSHTGDFATWNKETQRLSCIYVYTYNIAKGLLLPRIRTRTFLQCNISHYICRRHCSKFICTAWTMQLHTGDIKFIHTHNSRSHRSHALDIVNSTRDH